MDYKLVLGKNIRALRKNLGYSQEGLAHSCGLDRTYVGGIERGERNVSLENIVKLSKTLRVAPGKLLEPEEDTV